MNNVSTTSYTTNFIVNAVVLCVVNAVSTFAGIFLNSVVIMSLWNSQLRKKLCYFMILILACFDLAVVVIVHPLIILRIISFWAETTNSTGSALGNDLIPYLFALSSIALVMITLERYLALVHPFPHKRFVTKGRLMIALVVFQLPFSVIIVLRLNGLDLPFQIAFLFAVMYLVLCILNFKLFHIAKTVGKRAAVILGNLDGSESDSRNVEMKKVKVSLASLRKISTCLLAVVCYFVCNVPSIVRFGLIHISTDQRHLHNVIMKNWAETFLALNSSVNCLIFFYKNSVLRRHGKMFLTKCFCRRSPIS